MKVRELRKAIEGLSDDAVIYYERIEDVYFDKHGWGDSSLHVPDEFHEIDSEYIPAFGASRDKNGEKLLISAHY